MSQLVSTFTTSLKVIKQDKVNLALCFAPVIIGILLYLFLGNYFYGDLREWIHSLVASKINSETWGAILYYILIAMVWILIFFLVNWTFVLVVSLIASPFNDILSERTEKWLKGEEPSAFGQSLRERVKQIFKIIFNELKKISFIVVLSILAFVLNFFPLFTPFSLLLTALLMAINFLDYSWSRHQMTLSQCLSDLKQNIWIYLIAGFAFVFIMTVPMLNLIALPFGVVYFTLARLPKKD